MNETPKGLENPYNAYRIFMPWWSGVRFEVSCPSLGMCWTRNAVIIRCNISHDLLLFAQISVCILWNHIFKFYVFKCNIEEYTVHLDVPLEHSRAYISVGIFLFLQKVSVKRT